RVLAGDGKLCVAIVEQPSAQQARLDAEVFPSEAVLDGDLPQAGGAEAKLIARSVQALARRRRETLRLTGRPEQELGVQQQLHPSLPNRAAISASPMRLKSSGTAISPARKPSRCGVGGASSATTFTSGLPALAITNASPLTA